MKRLRALAAAGLLVAVVVSWPGAWAGHSAAPSSYTGCLATTGRNKGKVSKMKAGNTPVAACTGSQVQIHVSGGDIIDVTAGTGLTGGGTDGAPTVNIAGSYRLPQGCSSDEIPAWGGSAWICAPDDPGIDDSQSGRLISRSLFSVSSVDTIGAAGGHVSAAVGWDGLPVISYYDDDVDDLKVAHCGNPACTSGNVITTVDEAGVVGLHTSIAVGADGFPVVSYYDDTNGDLKLAHCEDVACTSATIEVLDDTLAQTGQFTSIAIGSDGFPVVAYRGVSNGDLQVAHCNDVACSSHGFEIVEGGLPSDGEYASMAIGSDGFPIISHYRGVFDKDLRVAHCTDVTCSGTVDATSIDTVGDVGFDTSIAVGTDGLPVVSYHDDSNDDLKVAHCSNVACTAATTEQVDTTGAVGFFTSITIGVDGLPVVSYAESGGDVRFAHCGNVDCSASNVTTAPVTTGTANDTAVSIGSDDLPVVAYFDLSGAGSLKVVHCSSPFCVPSQRPS